MAGTFTIKLLAEGQLPSSKGTIYTVPALTSCIIKTITLVNTGSNTVVNLYIKKAGSTSRRIIPKNIDMGGSYLLETDEEYILEAGDIVEGDAVSATQVDYSIHGVEET